MYNIRKSMIEEFQEGGLKILLYLGKRGEAILSDFKRDLGMGSNAVYKAISVFYKYGIIIEDSRGAARVFRLNDKGKKIAEYLMCAEELLTESA